MRLTVPITAGVAIILAGYACGGTPAPPPPPPINQDSIDSVAAARRAAEEMARQDSIRRAQEEAARIEAQRQREAEAARIAAETARVREALAQLIHFDYDRSNVKDEFRATLDMKVRIMRANPDLRIRISGHCDERGSDEYNLALGNRRAVSAMQYLVNNGIAADRITTESFGEERPLNSMSNEAAWEQNRRDEFTITAGGSQLRMPSM